MRWRRFHIDVRSRIEKQKHQDSMKMFHTLCRCTKEFVVGNFEPQHRFSSKLDHHTVCDPIFYKAVHRPRIVSYWLPDIVDFLLPFPLPRPQIAMHLSAMLPFLLLLLTPLLSFEISMRATRSSSTSIRSTRIVERSRVSQFSQLKQSLVDGKIGRRGKGRVHLPHVDVVVPPAPVSKVRAIVTIVML